MRYSFKFVSLSFVLFLFVACKSGGGGSSKDEPSTGDNFKITPVAQQTIGVSGGQVTDTTGARVFVEPNGFSTNANLKVSTIQDLEQVDDAYTASVVTQSYRLEGLPNDSREPITLSLPLTKQTSGESYIVIEYEAMQSSPLREGISRELLPAEVIDGHLVAKIPPYGNEEDPSPIMRSSITPHNASGFRNTINYQGLTG